MVRTVRYLLSTLVLFSTTFGLAQQPFLSSDQWVKLRDEANGTAPYENEPAVSKAVAEPCGR